ncbi:hypothetical protein MHYP_G00357800 [Metynnis hypsauchen]
MWDELKHIFTPKTVLKAIPKPKNKKDLKPNKDQRKGPKSTPCDSITCPTTDTSSSITHTAPATTSSLPSPYRPPPPSAPPAIYPEVTALSVSAAPVSAPKPKQQTKPKPDPVPVNNPLSSALVKVPSPDSDSDTDDEGRDPDYNPETCPDPPPGPWSPTPHMTRVPNPVMAWHAGPGGVEYTPPDFGVNNWVVRIFA